MGRINSKNKGSTFERTVANLLSNRLHPLAFQRIQSSGAFLGGKNTHRISNFSDDRADSFIGDVFCTNDKNFRFTIECKSYKEQVKLSDFYLESFIIFKWFNECVFDCQKNNKEPLLIFKFNRSPTFYCMYADPKIHDDTNLKYKGLVIGLLDDLINKINDINWWKKND